ncbi:MAG: hypothetical protein KKG10_07770 [Proteobacteria bacterium]|nr:hypothetical protein [Pseudomonadota bacterium]
MKKFSLNLGDSPQLAAGFFNTPLRYNTLACVGGLYGFGFASKGHCPLKDFDPGRVYGAHFTTRWYTPNIHRASFMLPSFLEKNLAGILDPLKWQKGKSDLFPVHESTWEVS